ncbi:MAG TPA: RNA polymerase sigma factor [Actinomycetota bacterium]
MSLPPFQELLDRHRTDVYRFCVAAAGAQDADDCFQETFMAALRAYPRLRDGENLRGWLLTIARRKAIDEHRSRARRAVPAEGIDTTAAADETGDPRLWEAVRGLPPKQRAAVVYRFVSDLRYAEIGRLLDCSEAAARQNVRAGIARLREVWT